MSKSLSKRARQIVDFAQKEAISHGIDHVEPPHLLLGLLHTDTRWPSANIAVHVLENRQISIDALRNEVEAHITRGSCPPTIDFAELEPDEPSRLVLQHAEEEATQLGDLFVGCEHLLLGLMQDATLAPLLKDITPEQIREAARPA